MLYATSETGIFLSRDGGASWLSSPLSGSGAKVRAIATSLHHPESAYVSYSHLQLDGDTWMGVARTRDSGHTWSLVWKEGKTAAPNIHDAWISKEISVEWAENPLGIGVADQDPDLCLGTDFGRTMITTDGGATWTGAYSRKVTGGNWVSTGLDVTTNYGYLVDPFDADRHFIPTTDIGLFRSEDKGRSWARSVTGVPEQWSNTTYWVVFDPAVKGKMWGVMSGTQTCPVPRCGAPDRRRSIAAESASVSTEAAPGSRRTPECRRPRQPTSSWIRRAPSGTGLYGSPRWAEASIRARMTERHGC